MSRLSLTVVVALGLASIGSVATATEEPAYTVIQQHEGIEVRSYAPHLVAEVVVPVRPTRRAIRASAFWPRTSSARTGERRIGNYRAGHAGPGAQDHRDDRSGNAGGH
ncbi:MAG: heme-binding protein [Betaproteobacteria bacterium]|nr:heme-binding protein [Betaproteobacteria bacterium]